MSLVLKQLGKNTLIVDESHLLGPKTSQAEICLLLNLPKLKIKNTHFHKVKFQTFQ